MATQESDRAAVEDALRAWLLRLAAVLAIVAVLYFGRSFLLPLCVAGLLAVLVDPIRSTLVRWGAPDWLGISVAWSVPLLAFVGLFFAVGDQALRFVERWPRIEEEVRGHLVSLRAELPPGLTALVGEASTSDAASSASPETEDPAELSSLLPSLTDVASITMESATAVFLTFVYVALFLAHRERIRAFLSYLGGDSGHVVGGSGDAVATIEEGSAMMRRYLRGRIFVVGILTVLYGIGFALIGLDYALVVALIAGVLSIVPYLGNVLGALLALATTLTSGGSLVLVLGVIGTMSLGQVLENYVLTPIVVGNEVSLNSMAVIVGVVALSLLWGPLGAVLAIPLIALAKVLLESMEGFDAWAELLADDG